MNDRYFHASVRVNSAFHRLGGFAVLVKQEPHKHFFADAKVGGFEELEGIVFMIFDSRKFQLFYPSEDSVRELRTARKC